MAREQVTDLFISSGDGTIQEILTLVAERGDHPVARLSECFRNGAAEPSPRARDDDPSS